MAASSGSDRNFRVVVVIPFGRKPTVQCLLHYLDKQLDIIDEVVIWRNTRQDNDLQYLAELEKILPAKSPKFTFKKIYCGGIRGVYRLYRYFRQPGTLLIKIDDDIVYMDDDCLAQLIDFAATNRGRYTCFSANVVNNGLLDRFHQQIGASSSKMALPPDHIGIFSRNGAIQVHSSFLRAYGENCLDSYRFCPEYVYRDHQRWSINLFAFFPEDLSDSDYNNIEKEDELFFSEQFGLEERKYAAVCGRALAVHYSFGPQKINHFDLDLAILQQYRQIAGLS